ncbi:PepSY domain-containing protein [Priestia aryabhattai]|uniref:PepSY domain-containing protein n=1 Tax=Priestia aryabhattai TaxID=412384 RepID=UPI0008DE34B2|nr:PepSY domain-containing protein [Priestia aryabhattai]MBZ6484951.1 PepSY domain-containing protein [Priestia aryabhattai]MDH3111539.1 PepSY domain-containing protein [Priestia aryabhattai]MDH3129543.1 PepSY domain-containing protein [Priestia aryabhattai]MDH3135289.1 PepSY domain-containing protein [Priestia aryabhattai]MED4156011.1 PepSY domain-containing protein [Priestia aryabhattai]
MKVITTVLASAVLVGGLGASAYAMTDQSKSNDKKQTTTIEEAKAKDIALQKTDGGDITNIQLDVDNGVKQYEVDITKGNKEYDVDIDSSSGKIIEFDEEQKDDEDEREENLQNASPAISLNQAIKTALKSAKGTVNETDLDQENDRLVYEIEIDTADKREATVSVDAKNGDVISVEIDD